MRELKTLPAAVVKAKGDTVTGIASTFGVRDSYDDIIHPGAYVESLARRKGKIAFLWSHQWDQVPTARITDIREVPRAQVPAALLAEYPEITGGLLVEREYFSSPAGQNAKEAVLNSHIEMSIGYNAQRFDFTEVDGVRVRNLRQIDLLEISDVVFGANEATVANVAEAKGYRYAGGFHAKAGARHSAADLELLDRIHADAVALGATCDSVGKRAPSLPELGLKLARLQFDMLAGDDPGYRWDQFIAEVRGRRRA